MLGLDTRCWTLANRHRTFDIVGVNCTISDIRYSISDVQYPMSSIQCSIGNVQYPIGNVQCPIGNVECPIGNVECPISSVRYQMSDIQVLTSDGSMQCFSPSSVLRYLGQVSSLRIACEAFTKLEILFFLILVVVIIFIVFLFDVRHIFTESLETFLCNTSQHQRRQ